MSEPYRNKTKNNEYTKSLNASIWSLLAAGLFFLIPSVATADEFGISVRQGYAPISGYLQTPAGGEPGSSDIRRPTFDELDIDDTTYLDIDLFYRKGRYTPYIGLRFMTFDSSGVLEKDLTTRSQTFVKGESFDHETSFNIYRFGAKYDLGYLSPKAEFAIMDFDYEFDSSGVSVERSYAKFAVRLGAERTFRFDALEVILEASGSIPLANTPEIYTVAAGIKYWFAENFNVGLDVQYFYLDYEDNQDLPNHLRLEMKPAVSFLLQYRF
ncbi:MAG TPA: hypothetical protein DIU00_14470 [Phycisphaerales bacterium]|nr:hypothetical protein [Phycisphaerales bacterium]